LWALVLWHLVFLSSLRTPADFSCPWEGLFRTLK
jgi:hypothetical protein